MIGTEEIKDYYSAVGESEGGAITDNQIPATQLSEDVSRGSDSISVYDAGGFSVNDEIVIDGGVNREKRIIAAIDGNVFTLNVALINSYDAGTTVGKKNNLFPDVSAAQATTGITIYKKFFRKNTNSEDTWYAVAVWIAKQFVNAAVSIGWGINSNDDDDPQQGNMSAMTDNAKIALVSDGNDNRSVTLKGVDEAGGPISETVDLNGTNEVLSTNTFSRLYLAYVNNLDASNTITIKQGGGGETIGTIGPNKKVSFLWMGKRVNANNEIVNAEGGDVSDYPSAIKIGDVAPGGNFGIWARMMVPAGASAAGNNTLFVQSRGESA